MKVIKTKSVSALSAAFLLLTLSCGAYAAGEQGEMKDNPGTYSSETATTKHHRSYGAKVGNKLGRGFANMLTGIVEIPRTVINKTNAGGIGGEGSNIIWGLTAGASMGIVNMVGRTVSGVVDVITFPLPTKSIPNPEYAWEKFDQDTSYGPVMVLDDE